MNSLSSRLPDSIPRLATRGRHILQTLRFKQASTGLTLFILLCVGAIAITLSGVGGVSRAWLPASLVGVVILHRTQTSGTAALEFILYQYLMVAGVRRFSEAGSGFIEPSLTLATPYACSILALALAIRRVGSIDGLTLRVMGCYGTILTCGVAVALLRGNSTVGVLAEGLQWYGPLAVAAYGAALRLTPGELSRMALRLIFFALPVLSVYGLVQWTLLPEWDARWLFDYRDLVSSFGQPRPLEVRIFSLSNAPATLAISLVWLLSLSLRYRETGTTLLTALGLAVLAVTLVRAAWLAAAGMTILALLALDRRTRRGARRVAGVTLLGAAFAFSGLLPHTADITERVASLGSGTSDTSAEARLSFQYSAVPTAVSDPIGTGIGASGVAVRLAGRAGDSGSFANVDSGYLELLRTFGSVLGTLMIVLVLVIGVSSMIRLRNPALGNSHSGWAALISVTPLSMLFGNSLTGISGVIVLLGFALLVRAPSREGDAEASAR